MWGPMEKLEKPAFWGSSFWEANPSVNPIFLSNSLNSVWLRERGAVLQSGFLGPFGGFWTDSPSGLSSDFGRHNNDIEELAIRERRTILRVRLPPMGSGLRHVVEGYDQVRQHGWSIAMTETDHIVDLSQGLPVFNRLRRRNISQACALSYSSESGLHVLDEALSVVAINRASKSVPLTVSRAKAVALARLLGHRVRLSVVRDGEAKRVVAGSLSIILQTGVAYVIQWGHCPSVQAAVSPMALLAREVFSDLLQNGCHKALLGTSSERGEVNPGLARFKESLGAQPVAKLIIQKDLE